MADSRESLKRKNYFDLKRDEFMAMDEYLQSPISEIDLRKMNEGGIANIENMTGPIGMSGGGDFRESLSAMIAKLDSEIISLRLDQMLMGDDNEKAIQSKQNQLDYFKDQMKTLEK